jgi:hypothetical protein
MCFCFSYNICYLFNIKSATIHIRKMVKNALRWGFEPNKGVSHRRTHPPPDHLFVCAQLWPCLDTPAGLELELVSNSSSSSKLTLALEVKLEVEGCRRTAPPKTVESSYISSMILIQTIGVVLYRSGALIT